MGDFETLLVIVHSKGVISCKFKSPFAVIKRLKKTPGNGLVESPAQSEEGFWCLVFGVYLSLIRFYLSVARLKRPPTTSNL